MIDADLVWRAACASATAGRRAVLALALSVTALTATAAAPAEPPQRVLPWLAAQPSAIVVRPARALRTVAIRPVAALLPAPMITVTRVRGRRAPLVSLRLQKLGAGAPQYTATLGSPLPNVKVSSPFGSRVHPTRKRRGFHFGVDYSARPGTPILAAQDGEIKVLGRRRDYGRLLRIDHGHGVETLYGHLQRFVPSLRQGSRVRRGEVIGYVGSSGRATGPHLHFEVLNQGRPVDPLKLALAVAPGQLLSAP